MALDVYEEGDDYVIEAALPGVNPDAVNVSVLGNRVQISGECGTPPEGRQHLVQERHYGRFERTVTLPMEVDADKATANFEHGVLRLTVPKAESARPRRIATGSGPAQRRDPPPAVETRV
jgi:HSP20 family protein